MRLWVVSVLALAACDVAPRPIDLEQSSIETPDEGYQFFVDTIIASNTARRIAAGCRAFELDQAARDRQMRFFKTEMERLAVEDPGTFDAINRRIGVSTTAEEAVAKGYQGLVAPEVDTGFLVRNAGLTVDIGTRAIGMMARGSGDDACADGRREIAQRTRAGTFLTSGLVPEVIESPNFGGEDPFFLNLAKTPVTTVTADTE